MIPKIIHYVWVGNNPKPKDIKKCMKTWKKHLKDYKIIEWNESNFDISSHPFVKKAYEAKKWAYVSDYIRMYAIYNYGGIYLDTDVLVLENFDKFLNNKVFGFYILISHIIGNILTGLLFRNIYKTNNNTLTSSLKTSIKNFYYDINNTKIFKELLNGIKKSLNILINIFGIMTCFLIITKIITLKLNLSPFPSSILSGLLEMTTGLKSITSLNITEKTKLLLKKASPLMEIYTNDNKDAFDEFLKKEKNSKKDMKRLLANLPIFTIDDEILTKMLKRNKLTKDEIKLVLNYKKNMEDTTYNILKNNKIEDTIYNNDFNNDKPYLSLENMFFNKNIYYTKDEYLKHLNSTKKYCKSNNNYKLNIIDNKVFNNISITITNNYVIIYKNNNPQIKFVIKHSKLVNAISKFNPLVIEKN